MISCILNRQRWRVYEVNRLGADGNGKFGDCDYTKHILRILRGQTEAERLDTVVHEALHAACPFLDEHAVNQAATDIAGLLWKMGYRREA